MTPASHSRRPRPAWRAWLPAAALLATFTLALGAGSVVRERPASAATCPVTLTTPAHNAVIADSPLFKWTGSCAQYRIWFSPSGTFGADKVQGPWQVLKKYTMASGTWDAYQEGAWAGGVYWKVQSKAADGSLTFSATRYLSMAPITRFLAVGDTGNGDANQYAVAAAMEDVCAAEGCEFVLLLGDNIYPDGLSDPDPFVEPDWNNKFETPYAAFSIPFYPVMGNHDYGDDGPGPWPPVILAPKGQAAVDHTAYSAIWTMPDLWYDFSDGDASFFALDTSQPLLGVAYMENEQMEVGAAIAASTSPWKIAFGHYPYLSNGHHGDAGDWDNEPGRGAEVKEFLDETICGQVDLYLCGHEHNLQWLTDTCAGTSLIVSGSGSQTSTLMGTHPVHFQSATLGFFWFELQGTVMQVVVYDSTGAAMDSGTITH